MANKYFGTDGVRGVFGKTLKTEMAYSIGRYIGQYPNGKKNRIILARDTRLSGEPLSQALSEGVKDSGGILVDEGISSTSSLSYLVTHEHFDFGVMISASHNAYQDNGIKIFSSNGEKLSEAVEAEIENYIDSLSELPKKDGEILSGKSLKEKYLSWLVSKAEPSLTGLKVLVDCANGSASSLAPSMWEKIGVKAAFINKDPNGKNINENCGSTHIDALVSEMKNGEFDIGFSYDGDADRCIAVLPGGRVLDGDAEMYLSAIAMGEKKIILAAMSNMGFRKSLEEEGIEYELVPVGDKYVQARLKELNLSLGGEQCGHIIFFNDLNTGDGLLTSIKIANILAAKPEVMKKLSSLKIYPEILENIEVNDRNEIASILKSKEVEESELKAETILGKEGRLLVRPSGTEPLIRVMAEHPDYDTCLKAVNTVKEAIISKRG